jgi:hypothetical protein
MKTSIQELREALSDDQLIKIGEQKKALAKNAGKGFSGVLRVDKSGAANAVTVDPTVQTEPPPAPEPLQVEAKSAETEPQVAEAPLTVEQVKSLLAEYGNNDKLAELQEELRAQKEDAAERDRKLAEAELRAAQAERRAAESEKDAQAIHALTKLMGTSANAAPMVNTQVQPNARPQGLAKGFFDTLNNSESFQWVTPSGSVETVRSGAEMSRYLSEVRTEGAKSWNQAIADIDNYFRAEFGDSLLKAAGATTGAPGRAPDMYLDTLSALVRETHNQDNIWWQFANTVFDPVGVPSRNVLVPRFNYLPAPANLADYELSTYSTFSRTPSATGDIADSESLEETSVSIIMKEWGRGKEGVNTTRPIYLPAYHTSTSLLNLVEQAYRLLGQNFFAFQDLLIRSQYNLATQVYYNKDGVGVSTAASLTAGDGGTCTRKFVGWMQAQMHGQKIPALPDGQYMSVLNSYSAKDYIQDLQEKLAALPSQAEIESVTRMITSTTGVNIGQVAGYIGCYDGFHHFRSNASGVGAAGTPGVQSETLGGTLGAQLTRDCYFFGPGAVGMGVGMPMQIVPSGVNAYNRGESYIWLTYANAAPLDVDATISTPGQLGQQTKVLRARFLDRAV